MTVPTPEEAREAAAARIADITDAYERLRICVDQDIEACGPLTPSIIKQMLTKIADLTSAHLLVLKAEEAFHDKFTRGGEDDPQNELDAIRDEIGRRLDRLRIAVAEARVSGQSE